MNWARILKASAVAAILGTPLAAQDAATTLTPNQMRNLSVALLESGKPGEAAALADLLLQRDPEDVTALIVRAQAAASIDDAAGVVHLAGRAYRATDDRNARFIAARLTARGHAELGQDTRSQIWLRRARQFAPNPQEAAAIANDYRFLRNRNPWSTTLRFGITPSSNINNGSANETTTLFGFLENSQLSGDARALSGFEVSAGFSSRYRLNADDVSGTFLDLDGQTRTYIMSDDAKAQAPDANGSDFADTSLGFGITHRRILSEGANPTTFNARLGQNWYSGDPYTRTLDVRASHNWTINPTDSIGASITAQERRGLQEQLPTRTYGLNLNWGHGFANGDRVQLGAGYSTANSDDFNNESVGRSVSASYDFAQAVSGLRFGVGMTISDRNWDLYTIAGGAREDKTAAARVRVTFTNIEYFGFQPVVNFEATRTHSNVELFDRDYLRVGFDLQSSF